MQGNVTLVIFERARWKIYNASLAVLLNCKLLYVVRNRTIKKFRCKKEENNEISTEIKI